MKHKDRLVEDDLLARDNEKYKNKGKIINGCGNRIVYPDIVCGAMFGGKIYLCEKCKEKGERR